MYLMTRNFKDLIQSILTSHSKKDAPIFATCVWLIWYVRNRFRYERDYYTEPIINLQARIVWGIIILSQHATQIFKILRSLQVDSNKISRYMRL